MGRMGFSTGRFAGQPIRRCFVYCTWLSVKMMSGLFGRHTRYSRKKKGGRWRNNSLRRLKQLRCKKLKRGTSSPAEEEEKEYKTS